MDSFQYDLIRQIEREVLDVHHRSYPLLRLSQNLAVTRLLKITGDLSRQRLFRASSEDSVHRAMGRVTRGLSHCLRWALNGCSVVGDLRGNDHAQEDEWALEFLRWGTNYGLLATDHVAWSKALQAASVDPSERVITFHPFLDMDVGFYTRQALADLNWCRSRTIDSFPAESFARIFIDWQRKSEWTNAGLEFESTVVRRHNEFATVRLWIDRQLFPELPSDRCLGEYNLGDLRQFFASLYTICECVRTLEDEVDQRVGDINRMGTWTFQGPRPRMVAWLTEASAVGRRQVDAITRDMTLNPNRFHCSISTTPFVQTTDGSLYLLPRLFACLDPERSFASALTVGTGRNVYDRISTELERHALLEIDAFLSSRGLRIWRERRFVGRDGEVIKPDFVIADGATNEVIVADFKNALAATAVAEVMNRIKVQREAITQLEHYLEVFQQCPRLLDDILPLGCVDPAICGLVIFRVPTPLPVRRHDQIWIDDWFSVRTRLRASHRLSLRELLPPESDERMELRHTVETVAVGEWTYRRAVLQGTANPM
jgi:hypothetical protein